MTTQRMLGMIIIIVHNEGRMRYRRECRVGRAIIKQGERLRVKNVWRRGLQEQKSGATEVDSNSTSMVRTPTTKFGIIIGGFDNI